MVVCVDEVDLHHRLVQVVAFDAVVRINMRDVFPDNGQFQPDSPAAVEKPVRQEQQKSTAFSRLARLTVPAEIVYPETHGQNFLIAEALFDPFAVTPADKGNVADDAEKNESDVYPLLVGVEVLHGFLFNPRVGEFLL